MTTTITRQHAAKSFMLETSVVKLAVSYSCSLESESNWHSSRRIGNDKS
jgi:hypothetical protein